MAPKKKKIVQKEAKFKIESLANVTTKNGKLKKRVTRYSLTSGKDLTYKDTQKIYQRYLSEGIAAENIYINVMAHRFLTLKSLGESEFKDWDSQEYYQNRVMDPGAFLNHFRFVQIVVLE